MMAQINQKRSEIETDLRQEASYGTGLSNTLD
jgi:hypothetical protein